jgi:hypothetical protein
VTEGTGQMHYFGDFSLEFVNHGRSPAFLMELLDTYPTEAKGAFPYPLGEPLRGKGLPEGTISAPGAPFSITKKTLQVYDKILEPNAWQEYGFFTVGFLRYGDIFGNVYVLGYCGLYDPLGERFVLYGGDKLNFTLQEKWADGRKPRKRK